MKFHKQLRVLPHGPPKGGSSRGGSRALYSQGSDLGHVVEAGHRDGGDVVVVEGAADREERHVNKGVSWEVPGCLWTVGKDGYDCKRDHPSAARYQAAGDQWMGLQMRKESLIPIYRWIPPPFCCPLGTYYLER